MYNFDKKNTERGKTGKLEASWEHTEVSHGKGSMRGTDREVRHGKGSLEWIRQRKVREMGGLIETDRSKTWKLELGWEQTK